MANLLEQWISKYNGWMNDFKGQPYKEWMSEHPEVPALVILFYVAVVLYVPEHVMKNRQPLRLNFLNRAWNLLLTVFSNMGFYYTGIRLFQMVRESYSAIRADLGGGIGKAILETSYPVLCVWNEKNFFNGPVGFFVLTFILSKLFETIDTVFLVAQKKSLIFLHWYHHITVMLYGWHAYTNTISSGLVFAVMNYAVHSVMYFYYFLCTCGMRRYLRPIAPLITFLQILQMVLGTVFQAVTYYLATYSERGCDVNRRNSRLGLIMYLSYLGLFVKLFYEKYLSNVKDLAKEPPKNGNAPAPYKNRHASPVPKVKNGLINKKVA